MATEPGTVTVDVYVAIDQFGSCVASTDDVRLDAEIDKVLSGQNQTYILSITAPKPRCREVKVAVNHDADSQPITATVKETT